MSSEELLLIEAARAGDDAATEELGRRYIPKLRQLARKAARAWPGHREEDLLGAAWLGFYAAALRYDRASDASLWTYAGRRAYGAMLDDLRRERAAAKPIVEVEASEDNEHAGGVESLGDPRGLRPAAVAEAHELCDRVLEIDAGDSRCASAIRHRLDGLCTDEVGAALGVSSSRASQLVSLMRAAVAKAWPDLSGSAVPKWCLEGPRFRGVPLDESRLQELRPPPLEARPCERCGRPFTPPTLHRYRQGLGSTHCRGCRRYLRQARSEAAMELAAS